MSGLTIPKYGFAPDFLTDINFVLDKGASLFVLNEPWLVQRLNELDARAAPESVFYWLTLARLNELALYCAGNYADNRECVSAGDLLVNPRLTMVHVRGHNHPFVKKRHTPLSIQFAHMAQGTNLSSWLKQNTVVEIVDKALLAELYHRLNSSNRMSKDYLESVAVRHQQIAHTTTFLASVPLCQYSGYEQYRRFAPPQDWEYIESQLCLFDTSFFTDLGDDLHIMTISPGYHSPFLS